MPLVTVGVPAFNAAATLKDTLEALSRQTLDDFEVIIADNASSDSTTDIATSFARSDPRFRLLTSDRNRGLPWNYNRLLAQARSAFFMWNDADDLASADHLAACCRLLETQQDAVLAFGLAATMESDGTTTSRGMMPALESNDPARRLSQMLRHQVWLSVGNGAVIRTSYLRGIGGLPFFAHGDITLAVQLALAGVWLSTGQWTYTVRHHPAQMHRLVGRSPREVTLLYRPDFTGTYAFPAWYHERQLMRAVLTDAAPPRQRLRCLSVVGREWSAHQWRPLGLDIKLNVGIAGNRMVRRLVVPSSAVGGHMSRFF